MREALHSVVVWGWLGAAIVLSAAPADAAWRTMNGRKVFGGSDFAPVATTPGLSPSRGITARLQIECSRDTLPARYVMGVVLAKPLAPGLLSWRQQIDGRPPSDNGPHSLASLTNISLGLALSDIAGARRLRLTLLPADNLTLTYSFDLAGIAQAVRTISCR